MKRYTFLTIMAAMMLYVTTPATAQKHRHHPVAQQTTQVADTTDNNGIEAFSDTTSVVDPAQTSTTATQTYTVDYDEDIDDMFSGTPLDLWAKTIGFGIGGIFLAIFILLLLFLLCISPFIILALIIRMLIKRHNDNVTLSAKAIEQGQPLPETDVEIDTQYREKGVKNTSIGVGLLLMGMIMEISVLSAVGALVACYGLGYIYISRKNDKNKID